MASMENSPLCKLFNICKLICNLYAIWTWALFPRYLTVYMVIFQTPLPNCRSETLLVLASWARDAIVLTNVQCLLCVCFQNQSFYSVYKAFQTQQCGLSSARCRLLCGFDDSSSHHACWGTRSAGRFSCEPCAPCNAALLPGAGGGISTCLLCGLHSKAPTSRNTYLQRKRQNFGSLKTPSHCVLSNVVGAVLSLPVHQRRHNLFHIEREGSGLHLMMKRVTE